MTNYLETKEALKRMIDGETLRAEKIALPGDFASSWWNGNHFVAEWDEPNGALVEGEFEIHCDNWRFLEPPPPEKTEDEFAEVKYATGSIILAIGGAVNSGAPWEKLGPALDEYARAVLAISDARRKADTEKRDAKLEEIMSEIQRCRRALTGDRR